MPAIEGVLPAQQSRSKRCSTITSCSNRYYRWPLLAGGVCLNADGNHRWRRHTDSAVGYLTQSARFREFLWHCRKIVSCCPSAGPRQLASVTATRPHRRDAEKCYRAAAPLCCKLCRRWTLVSLLSFIGLVVPTVPRVGQVYPIVIDNSILGGLTFC